MNPPDKVIAIGASAGGINAVKSILGQLPLDLPAAVLVVIHTSSESPGLLSGILQRATRLDVRPAEHGTVIKAGTVYVAPGGKHLILNDAHLRLTRGPMENRVRPAIDATFRSVATVYGPRGIGVVLTGYLDDGTAGLASIKRHGGKAIVQDPEDAEVPGMPQSAIANVEVDAVAPLARIPELLRRYAAEQVSEAVREIKDDVRTPRDPGNPSVYTCPECHGTLWEVEDGSMLRFECRVGHAYSVESMVEDQNESTERAIWAALRALEESAQLSRRLMHRSGLSEHRAAVERYQRRAMQAEEHIRVLRRRLGHVEPEEATSATGTRTSGV